MLKANLVHNSSGSNSLFFQSKSRRWCWTLTQGSRVLLLPRVTRGHYQLPNRWKSSSSLWISLSSVSANWSGGSFHSLVWRLSKFPSFCLEWSISLELFGARKKTLPIIHCTKRVCGSSLTGLDWAWESSAAKLVKQGNRIPLCFNMQILCSSERWEERVKSSKLAAAGLISISILWPTWIVSSKQTPGNKNEKKGINCEKWRQQLLFESAGDKLDGFCWEDTQIYESLLSPISSSFFPASFCPIIIFPALTSRQLALPPSFHPRFSSSSPFLLIYSGSSSAPNTDSFLIAAAN